MIRLPSVYTASKLRHAAMWRELRVTRPDVAFTARWPDIEGQVPDTPENAGAFWTHDVADVRRADAVLVYAEPGEHLRGGLVEAGVALGLGKQVVVVGEHPDYGTWQYHPLVQRARDIDHALQLITGGW